MISLSTELRSIALINQPSLCYCFLFSIKNTPDQFLAHQSQTGFGNYNHNICWCWKASAGAVNRYVWRGFVSTMLVHWTCILTIVRDVNSDFNTVTLTTILNSQLLKRKGKTTTVKYLFFAGSIFRDLGQSWSFGIIRKF